MSASADRCVVPQAIKDVIGPQEDIPAPDMNTGACFSTNGSCLIFTVASTLQVHCDFQQASKPATVVPEIVLYFGNPRLQGDGVVL